MDRTAIYVAVSGQDSRDVYYARSETVTTIVDRDGVQWVLFVPTNGYNPGRAHRVRSDRVVIVKLDDKPAWGEPGSVPGGLASSWSEVENFLGSHRREAVHPSLRAHLKDGHGYMDGDLADQTTEQLTQLHHDQEPHTHRHVQPARISRTVDVSDYRTFAEYARDTGLDTLLVSDGEPQVARVTGPQVTVDAFLEAAGYGEADIR